MVDFSTTLKIAYISGCDPVVVSPLPFVVVRVVDMCFDASCTPAECGMTLCTPHLVASFDFINPGCTFGTWFGIVVE